MQLVRFVSVMPEVFTQPASQMPNTSHKERHQDRATSEAKRLPKGGLDHGDKKRRQEERDRRKHGPLSFQIFATVTLQDLINHPIPARLHVPRSLRVRIIGTQN